MRGNDHIAISIGSGLLLASPWFLTNTLSVFIFIAGIIIGSLLPDTDATDSKLHYMDGIARIFSLIMQPVIIPLTKLIFWIFKLPFNPAHRGSMHTFPGLIVYTSLLTALISSAICFIGFWNPIIGFFFIGLFIGGVLHIFEDCCTRSGLMPFKPFIGRKYAGGYQYRRQKGEASGLLCKRIAGSCRGGVFCRVVLSA
ncbi:MAG: metal-dependent hydrolase [Methanocalculus sp.]|uniref:metal-dependent hydrolase n=1 Tax=Methanocalculus sp. TaxID=2004547 RepID=UPI002716E27E|nr:metal-dependent hydrolase [Methanocalculus sp.]MDO9539390.1 metal-dependent hydrolase [Methanocalculus sp.]